MEKKDRLMEMNKKDFPILLKKEIDLEMVGQNDYKKAIAMAVYRHIYMDVKCPLLVYGPTGSGKSMLFQLLKKSRLIPEDYTVDMANISRLTEEGYKGQSFSDVLRNYSKKCREQHNYELKGIFYLDEFDKLTHPDISTNDNGETYDHNEALLYQIMQILDGETIDGISTRNILFVFGGAFNKLNDFETDKAIGRIGFNITDSDSCDFFNSDELSIRNRLLDVGVPREFLGRIKGIVGINKLSRNELKAIITHPTKGTIAKLKKQYSSDDIKLDISDEVVEEIIDSVITEDLGARSVDNVFEVLLDGAWYQCLENDYNRIVINRESLISGHPKFEKVDSDYDLKIS